jgi:hypothetical protein
MPGNRKKQRPAGKTALQIARSQRNKQRRMAKARSIKENANERKSPWYIRAKLGNRLRRLNKKVLEAGPDRKSAMVDRINEIEKLLN